MNNEKSNIKHLLVVILGLAMIPAGCGDDTSEPVIVSGSGFQLTSDGGAEPSWSPDGEFLVYTNKQDLWTVGPTASATPTRLTSLEGVESSPAWQPGGGNKIAFIHEAHGSGSYSIQTVQPGSDPETMLAMEQALADLDFSPDGTRLAFRYLNGSPGIYLIDLAAETKVPLAVENHSGWGDIVSPLFSPVSDLFYYIELTDNADNIFTIPTTGGEPTRITAFDQATEKLEGLSVSPHERSLAFTLGPGPSSKGSVLPISAFALYTLRLDSGLTPTRHSLDEAGDALTPVWSPDGTRLAVGLKGDIWIIEPN
ncbi:TolB family protein [candidate division KSB1 bacterium]